MKYMLLLYVPAGSRDEDMESRAPMRAWYDFTRELREAGVERGNNALEGLATATTVRERDGERLIADGPFAETKEMLGGYYLIDVPDLDAALAWAAKVPNAPYGSVEVRPVVEFDEP